MKFTNQLITALVFAGCMLTACGGGSKTEDAAEEKDAYDDYQAAEEVDTKKVDQVAEGMALVEAGDCKTCHHPTNKIIGPSHTEVAEKYEFTEANVKMLAAKIINGGSGVWGEIMMNAHPNVTQVEAEKMARYVLSLDGETEK